MEKSGGISQSEKVDLLIRVIDLLDLSELL